MLGVPSKESHHVTHVQLAGGRLALKRHVSQLALSVLQINDSLLNRILDDHSVDFDIYSLIQTVDTVNGLFLNKLVTNISESSSGVNGQNTHRVPEGLQNHNTTGSSQVQTQSTGAQTA